MRERSDREREVMILRHAREKERDIEIYRERYTVRGQVWECEKER